MENQIHVPLQNHSTNDGSATKDGSTPWDKSTKDGSTNKDGLTPMIEENATKKNNVVSDSAHETVNLTTLRAQGPESRDRQPQVKYLPFPLLLDH